jgi:predicted TIM-barrel fold metal-dependent hydrolase
VASTLLIVDSQIHVWERDSPERPWLESVRTPGRPEFTAQDALGLMDAAGVGKAIIIPPIWSRFRNDYVFECVERHPARFAAFAWFDPTGRDARTRLEGLAANPRASGIRMLLAVPPGDAWLRDGHLTGGPLDWFWGAAEELGIPVAVRLTNTVGELGSVASAHPNLILIVDHCAFESEPGPSAFAPLDALLTLAVHDNVNVKLSALAKYSRMRSPYPDLDAVAQRVVTAFGAGRCMWGSDITQSINQLEYGPVVDHFRLGCDFLTLEERAAVLGGTALGLLGGAE